MTGILIQRMLRRSLTQIRHVAPVPPGAAHGLVAEVYAQVERDFGMLAPPVALHSPAPRVLAACWLMLRETLLVGRADRGHREAVAAAVSLCNTCPYCVDVHTTTLNGLRQGPDALAIAGDRIESVADPALRETARWARAGGTVPAPFPVEHTAEMVGVAVTFHYLNRMVNVFLGDSPLPPEVPTRLRGGMMRMLGRLTRPSAGDVPRPGGSLGMLPAAPLPDDLSWTADHPNVASAFARAANAIDTAAARTVPEPVRALVTARLAAWDGRPLGLRRDWLDDAVSRLDPTLAPACRLALLTAMSSYQVGEADIEAFRLERPGDDALIELTSWASLAAARRAGTRLAERPLSGSV